MSHLAERKHALIVQAELHRQVLVLESLNLQARALMARDTIVRNKWWLLGGGAVVAGLLMTRRPSGLLKLLPTVLSAWRSFRTRSGAG